MVAVALATWMLESSCACAGLPAAEAGRRVYDLAGVLTDADRRTLADEIAAVEQATSAQLAVVTVTSLDGQTVERYANQLFNAWGIGDRERHNGVMFLVAPTERRARIEVGYGLEPLLPDEVCGDILAERAIPRFKAGDFSGGIIDGTREILRMLRGYPDAARGIHSAAPRWLGTPRRQARAMAGLAVGAAALFGIFGMVFSARRRYPQLAFWTGNLAMLSAGASAAVASAKLPDVITDKWLWLGGGTLVPLLALVSNVRKYARYGPHACRRCGSRTELLSEVKDDEHLDAAQRLEEKLGSVDYDVWVCRACLATYTEEYIAWFSGLEECVKCRHRTCRREREIIRSATTFATGLAESRWECMSCRHRRTLRETIPIVMRSSGGSSSGGFGGGSGGGSFGGGSSGGGGASGGW